jgi:hypothetical protein
MKDIFTNDMYTVRVETFPYPEFDTDIEGYAIYNIQTGLREMECRTLPGAIGYATQLCETTRKLYEELEGTPEQHDTATVN